jgi:cell division initiation protein
MPITPLDIRKKTFTKKNLQGVDPKEVKDFLEQVARDLEAIYKERALLADKVDELNAKLEGFTRTEKAFQQAFATAQQTCSDMKSTAQQEAAAIIERAKIEGEKIVRKAEDEKNLLARELGEMGAKKSVLLGELTGLAESVSRLVEHWEDKGKPKA